MDRLAVYNGQRLIEKVDLGSEPISIGRDLSNRIALDDGSASRVHARVIPRGGQLLVTDPGSTNGVHVNGQRIAANTEVEVKPGDVVVIGTHRLILERTAEAAQRPAKKAGATQVLTAFAETMLGDMLRAAPKEPQTNDELETLARQAGARMIVCQASGPVAYDVAKSRVKIGRTPANDIVIDHGSVSHAHAELTLKAELRPLEGIFQMTALLTRIHMSGGITVDLEKANEIKSGKDQAVERLRQALSEIENTGVLVKDLDIGLLDFPTLLDDTEVYLCWKLGEPHIGHWHHTSEGFAGRKSIDRDFLERHRGGRPN